MQAGMQQQPQYAMMYPTQLAAAGAGALPFGVVPVGISATAYNQTALQPCQQAASLWHQYGTQAAALGQQDNYTLLQNIVLAGQTPQAGMAALGDVTAVTSAAATAASPSTEKPEEWGKLAQMFALGKQHEQAQQQQLQQQQDATAPGPPPAPPVDPTQEHTVPPPPPGQDEDDQRGRSASSSSSGSLRRPSNCSASTESWDRRIQPKREERIKKKQHKAKKADKDSPERAARDSARSKRRRKDRSARRRSSDSGDSPREKKRSARKDSRSRSPSRSRRKGKNVELLSREKLEQREAQASQASGAGVAQAGLTASSPAEGQRQGWQQQQQQLWALHQHSLQQDAAGVGYQLPTQPTSTGDALPAGSMSTTPSVHQQQSLQHTQFAPNPAAGGL